MDQRNEEKIGGKVCVLDIGYIIIFNNIMHIMRVSANMSWAESDSEAG
jgi:hypothetical protein